jgi:hypothetical protein
MKLGTKKNAEASPDWHTKSLYISRAVSNFFGTEIEILAGFGPVGNTKKNWADYE